MLYPIYELNHAIMTPYRAAADLTRLYYKNPLNPLSHTPFGKQMVAGAEVFERLTRRYGKPAFDIDRTVVGGREVAVTEEVTWERPFGRIVHFDKRMPRRGNQPNVLIVAPMSGHYATLLRGTVEAMLPDLDVSITDWVDARMVPLVEGRFDLDTYIDYLIGMFDFFGGDVHVIAVCQPAVPVFAAVSVLESNGSSATPKSMTLMGGPIDTRINPTAVSQFAEEHDIDWFRRNVIMKVPFPNPGFMRSVYPGFLQLSGFMSMNLERHVEAHQEFYNHLVEGDGDSADKHREFYDEYLSVMDLTAEFYLQTVDTVFHRHALPKGEMVHNGRPIDPSTIRTCALLTIEGEKDDISGVGQTEAAHRLASNLPAEKHMHYEQPDVGHYGVFNGSRFRQGVAPRIKAFIKRWDSEETAATADGDGAAKVASAPGEVQASHVTPSQQPAPDGAVLVPFAPAPVATTENEASQSPSLPAAKSEARSGRTAEVSETPSTAPADGPAAGSRADAENVAAEDGVRTSNPSESHPQGNARDNVVSGPKNAAWAAKTGKATSASTQAPPESVTPSSESAGSQPASAVSASEVNGNAPKPKKARSGRAAKGSRSPFKRGSSTKNAMRSESKEPGQTPD